MIKHIEKRDGSIVEFDRTKILNAILNAMNSVGAVDEEAANNTTTAVVRNLNKLDSDTAAVEDVQDLVEVQLMKKYPDVAREYITYRKRRNDIRTAKTETMKEVMSILKCEDVKNSNANVDEYSFGGRKKEASDVIQKEIALNTLIDPDIAEAHRKGILYIHDLSEYAVGLHNCLNADIAYCLAHGFEARNGGVRPANSFATACQLIAVIFQIQSQCQFGGIATTKIDFDLAPYVRISFLKHFKRGLRYFGTGVGNDYDTFVSKYGKDVVNTASIDADWNIFKDFCTPAYIYALEELEREGKQGAQALYHNLNTLESRAGSQVPFTSINFGLDTSWEGRKATQWMMNASLDGIGINHTTSIFPISIFVYKKDVNDRPGTDNYDLKKLAIKSLTKRIYPNFVNADWQSNVPDVHPIRIVNKTVFHPIESEVTLRIDHHVGETKVFDPLNFKKTLVSDYEKLTLKRLINSIPEEYVSAPDEDGIQVIDLRFTDRRYLIKDSTSKFNKYNTDRNDHYTKLNWLAVDTETNEVAITTESFNYDIECTEEEGPYKAKVLRTMQLPKPEYNNDTEMSTMGCRTLVGYDLHGMGYQKTGRGNCTPVTINLARIGIRHGICLGERKEADIDGFFKELDEILEMCERELLKRFEHICSQDIRSGFFTYHNHVAADTEAALEKGSIYETMRHFSQALGYIGVANMCYAMFGKYHNQDKDVLKFAVSVVKHIADYAEECKKRHNLNFAAYATPAESTCLTLASKLQKEFGKIKGVCDREYLTNSHHVPVYENISVRDKIDTEAEFSIYPTAGCIMYAEMSSGVIGNPRAVEKIIDYAMADTRVPYFAINFPIDSCDDCGYTGEINTDTCPVCGSTNINRLRRVTGYITTDYRKFNKGKFCEVNDRVKHI